MCVCVRAGKRTKPGWGCATGAMACRRPKISEMIFDKCLELFFKFLGLIIYIYNHLLERFAYLCIYYLYLSIYVYFIVCV